MCLPSLDDARRRRRPQEQAYTSSFTSSQPSQSASCFWEAYLAQRKLKALGARAIRDRHHHHHFGARGKVLGVVCVRIRGRDEESKQSEKGVTFLGGEF